MFCLQCLEKIANTPRGDLDLAANLQNASIQYLGGPLKDDHKIFTAYPLSPENPKIARMDNWFPLKTREDLSAVEAWIRPKETVIGDLDKARPPARKGVNKVGPTV